MDFRSHAFLLEAIEQFQSSGELPKGTHLHKAMFFLRAMGVPVPFSFILYKHGPFSLDVESELAEMKSYNAICPDSRPGHSQVLQAGINVQRLKLKVQLSPEERRSVAQVCKFLAGKPLTEIEVLATAAWIKSNEQFRTSDEMARRLHLLKPYVSPHEATERVEEIETIISGGQRVAGGTGFA